MTIATPARPQTAPVPRPVRPFGEGIDELAPPVPPDEPPAEDTVPADVPAIRIVHGADQGEYRPVDGPQGREWSRLDGSYARISEGAATRAYRAGRLAILSGVPAAPPKAPLPRVWTAADLRRGPAVAQIGGYPRFADRAWYLGFTLGRDGIDAAPLQGWPADVRAAFLDGLTCGAIQRDADHEAEGCGEAGETHHAAEYHEMRMRAPLEG